MKLDSRAKESAKLWLVVVSAIVMYNYSYFSSIYAPGYNVMDPLGWWRWFDQGFYLRAAIDFNNSDYLPSNHYYPPLYPLLGSFFVKNLPHAPFIFIDSIAFVFFSYGFIKISSQYLGFALSFVLFCLTVYFNHNIMQNFVIPWSTACTIVAYTISLLVILHVKNKESFSAKALMWLALVMSLGMGGLGLARPIDALLASVFFSGFLILAYRRVKGAQVRDKVIALIPSFFALTVGPIFSVVAFSIFNKKVFGTILGSYFGSTASSSGYFFLELPKKAMSLLVDSYSLFLSPKASLLTHYPWLALAIAGMILCLFIGDALLRIICIALVVHFCLYAPYGDLLPNGIWLFMNVHYFKWMIPYLGLFAVLAVYWCIPKFACSNRQAIYRSVSVLVIVLLIFSISFAIKENSVRANLMGNILTVDISTQESVDFIDIEGVKGDRDSLYFGKSKLFLDGKEESRIKDFRFLESKTGARVFFNKALAGDKLTIEFESRVTLPNETPKVSAGNYSFSLSAPKLSRDKGDIRSAH